MIIFLFCDILENPTDKCDPTAITEKEIQNLLFICNHLFAQINTEESNVSENGDWLNFLTKPSSAER